MYRFIQTIRFAIRALAKSPLFTMAAVLSLALGFGANIAILTLVDQILLRSLPVKDPQRLVALAGRGPSYGNGPGVNQLSYPMYADVRDHNDVFTGMFCYSDMHVNLTVGDTAERISGELVSGTYFPVLGVGAAAGRLFTSADDQAPGGAPFVVLSYEFWRTRFGLDYAVIGRTILVNGYPLTIIGVSQAQFDGTQPGHSPQIRIPVMMRQQVDPLQFHTLNNPRERWVTVFGRLKPGVTIQTAKEALQPLFQQRVESERSVKNGGPGMLLDVVPASKGISRLRQQFSKALLALMAMVSVVLLISCANVANLLIVRATARQRSIAIRLALGADRIHIASQLLSESVLLGWAGVACGLPLGIWIDRILLAFLPPSTTPMTLAATPDWQVLALSAGGSLAAGLLFGLFAAVQSTRPDLAVILKNEAGAVVGGSSALVRKSLAVAQIVLSVVLLIGAGLFVSSLRNLSDIDTGIQSRNLLTLSVDPTLNGYPPARTLEYYRALIPNLRTLPGVESASLSAVPILEYQAWDQNVTVDSSGGDRAAAIDAQTNLVSPGYFETLRIPLLAGRDFTDQDDSTAPKVAIVNEKFAKSYLAGPGAIGRHIRMADDTAGNTAFNHGITIVGLVRNAKYDSLRDEIQPQVFLPYRQQSFAIGMAAYVRTARDPGEFLAAIRRASAAIDPKVPVFGMKTVDRQIEYALVSERLVASLSVGLGLIATLLAAVGLYGVIAYSLARRTREMGVRMALGAGKKDVMALGMKEVFTLAAIGVAIGVPMALALARLVRSQLYGISAYDPVTIVAAVAEIAIVAFVAGYAPARRATRVDPMIALRWE